jgi:glycosyltransferase involved in cell wall biosynthesis
MCAALSHGGIAHYSYALAEALQKDGCDTDVLMYSEPEYELGAYPHSHRVTPKLQLGTSPGKRLTSPVWNVATMLNAARGRGVAHFQWSLGPRNDRLVWPALAAAGKPIVYTAHDVLPHEPDIMSRQHSAWIYRKADAVIVHGNSLRGVLQEHFGVADSRVHVVPHGNYNFVADTPSRWDRESARASFEFEARDRVVLFFGLIRAYKGLDTLIDAVSLLNARGLADGRRLRLLVAGRAFKDHWQEGRYEERIREARLGDSVSLHLRHIAMAEIPRFFQAADVVAVPYRSGSQSGVLQLAHSFSKPSVATRVGSLGEALPEGLIRSIEPERPDQLADELGSLLGDDEEAARMGARARGYVDTALGWSEIAAKTRAIYAALR